MAAPTPVARSLPTGLRLPDGFKTLITFTSNPSVQLWEKTIKPPGVDGGDGIDTTTMHNIAWRTKQPRALRTLSESSFMASYDPDVYPAILNLINFHDTVTVRFPDGSTLAFYGYLQKFEPGELKEGEFPEATCQITPTNFDATNNVEAAPVFTAAAGT